MQRFEFFDPKKRYSEEELKIAQFYIENVAKKWNENLQDPERPRRLKYIEEFEAIKNLLKEREDTSKKEDLDKVSDSGIKKSM